MRINTDGRYAWRTDLYDDVGELLGEKTKAGAIDPVTPSATFTPESIHPEFSARGVKRSPSVTPDGKTAPPFPIVHRLGGIDINKP